MDNKYDLRNIAAAPDLVVRYIYPLKGNRAALGFDYTSDKQLRTAALQARHLNTTVLTGPTPLVQGGSGLVAQLPVFYQDQHGQNAFWGASVIGAR